MMADIERLYREMAEQPQQQQRGPEDEQATDCSETDPQAQSIAALAEERIAEEQKYQDIEAGSISSARSTQSEPGKKDKKSAKANAL